MRERERYYTYSETRPQAYTHAIGQKCTAPPGPFPLRPHFTQRLFPPGEGVVEGLMVNETRAPA